MATTTMSYRPFDPQQSMQAVKQESQPSNYHNTQGQDYSHMSNLPTVPLGSAMDSGRSSSVSSTKNTKVKRSASSPNVRAQAGADAASAAEKRRNKLGYHRTSVACTPADAHGRCSNCIRLKKECIFLPVDQQPQADTTHRRGSKVTLDSGNTSSPSSPSLVNEHHSGMQQQESLPHPYLTMPQIQEIGSNADRHPRTGSFSPEAKSMFYSSSTHLTAIGDMADEQSATAYARPYDYTAHSSTWPASEISPTTKPSNDAYWRSQESPITPAFPPTSNYSNQGHLASSISNWPPTSAIEPSNREDMWNMPQRSMSYGNLEGLPPHASNSFSPYHHMPVPSQGPREMIPRAGVAGRSDSYVPSLTTSGSVSSMAETAPADSRGGSMSGPAQMGTYGMGNQWQGYTYAKQGGAPAQPQQPPQPQEFGGWGYAGAQQHTDQQQPGQMYAHSEATGGLYYPNASHGG